MTTMTIAELAVKTKDELIRRGPVAGELAVQMFTEHGVNGNGEYEVKVVYRASLSDCKVCLLGAAGAARYNNPLEGICTLDPDYVDFRKALADVIEERYPEYRCRNYINDTIVEFFDDTIEIKDPRIDASDRLGPVLEVLDELALRYPDNTERKVVA